MRARLNRIVGGAAATPLLVLFGLNLVDEFDRVAFAALSPEIRDAFHLSDAAIGGIGAVAGGLILLAALPIGVLADRWPRVRIGVVAALLWSTMSVLTGVVPTVALLFVVRLLSGFGRVANEVVHPSLLTDYYDKQALPRVFQVHRLANPLSAASGILAGGIAAAIGWRWAFWLLSIPTFLLLAGLARLREPERGASLDADLAADAAAATPVPFGEARRQLFAVPTLRRLWAGSFFNGAAIVATPQLLALFYEDVYGYGPLGRGFATFLFGFGTVVGLFIGGAIADRASREGDTPRLAVLTGASGIEVAAGMLLMALAPWSWASLVAVFLFSLGIGSYQPGYFPLVGLVAPPRVRSQSYAYAIVFLTVGAFLSVILYSVGDASGYRLAFGLLAGSVAVAGAIGWSSKVFVRRDIAQAEATLAAIRDLREHRERGDAALLTCRGVEVAYGQVQVLFGVDLEVDPGEIVALLGTNGAGKSTLLKAVSGLVDPVGGTILFDGQDITHADARQAAAAGIVQVPGGKAVFPSLSIDEHLRLAGWREDEPDRLRAATERVFGLFPVLRDRRSQPAGNLSGGEQQMLALGMALLARPRLLIIDELSLGLAPAIVGALLDVVRTIRDEGTAVLVVEQSVNVALTIADRATFLEKGEVRFDGDATDLLEREDVLRSVFLASAADAAEADADTGAVGTDATVDLAVTAPTGPTGGEEGVIDADVLVVEDVVKRFGGIHAVDGASLRLAEGEILGIIGPNGAGKTTLFDLISGYLPVDEGRVLLDGADVTGLSAHDRAWAGLGRSFQDARLVPSLSVAENLAIGLERHLPWRDHLASTLRLPAIVRGEEDVAYSVGDLVDLLGLGAYRDKLVRELSTGTRRVVDLGMVIAHAPRVLLLDEPSSGIAQRETEALGPLLKRIQRETGCALLVIEHDMPLITGISDRLVAMELGRPIAEGTPDAVVSDPRVVASYLGDDTAAVHRSGDQEATA